MKHFESDEETTWCMIKGPECVHDDDPVTLERLLSTVRLSVLQLRVPSSAERRLQNVVRGRSEPSAQPSLLTKLWLPTLTDPESSLYGENACCRAGPLLHTHTKCLHTRLEAAVHPRAWARHFHKKSQAPRKGHKGHLIKSLYQSR